MAEGEQYERSGAVSVLLAAETSHKKEVAHQKQRKISCLHGFLSLRRLFYLIGYTVGAYPFAYLTVAALISINSGAMYKMVLKDRIRDGYTPTNAPSRYETDVLREFYNISGDPAMTIVLLQPKNKTSMHEKANLDEAERLIKFISEEFEATNNGQKVRFSDMCEPYCGINKVFELFKSAFDEQYARVETNQSLLLVSNLSYPLATVKGFQVHLERSFFGVVLQNNSNAQDEGQVELEKLHRRVTNMKHVQVIVFIFRGDRNTKQREEELNRWELALYEWGLTEHKSEIIDLQVVGTEILDNEMMKDGRRLTPFFAAGFGFEITFVSACVILSAVFHDHLDAGKIIISLGAVLCPILAITSTYGIVSILDMRINSFMLVMPFLVMGIGVDSCFLMIHSWQTVRSDGCSTSERLGMVYETVGPSITITSLTDFLSFAIGALAPTPETRLFCIASFIALALTYILQLVLFGPILALATRFERTNVSENQNSKWRNLIRSFWTSAIKVYCKLLVNRVFFCLVVVFTAVYWYFAIYGLLTMKTRLDTVKILPKDSPLQKPNRVLTNIVWAEYHPVTIIVNTRLDVTDKYQMKRFWSMVDDFETMPHSKGSTSSLLWLRDYIQFWYYGEPYDIWAILGLSISEPNPIIDPLQANITTGKLSSFLRSPFYAHWQSFIHIENKTGDAHVERFMMSVAYQNTSQWDTRIQLMSDWRQIASNYSDLNVTVWEPNGMFVDQMLSLGKTATQTALWTLICMAVVCAIFIPNPCSVTTAAISIASITVGVMGFLSLWNFDLDPVVMAAVLMSIGLSVDFIAHVAYHFQLAHRKEIKEGEVVKIPLRGPTERLEHTLDAVAWPMIQAGVSTICCILPLLFRASYSPSVFVAAIFLVVSLGMLHGLLILPSFLAALPESLTTANCYRIFLSTSSERSCRYVDRRESAASVEMHKIPTDDESK
ncbi:unnamed protein product [Caenorhabditis auriculariae]|uniref:SSD domain-containing protein n=1 Tax=Caenorhabditis auriculariae TaxID=2777116 RepID=A0A8S1H1D5_9PELO|nr:unnamed protein product [Caenorhabditis auriculariae]